MLLLPLCAALAEATDGEAEYYGTIGKKMTVYRDANEDSAQLGKIEAGTVVDVYKKGRDSGRALAMRADRAVCLRSLCEMVQRKNPFDGPMGTSRHVAVGYVLTDTMFTEGFRYPIQVSAEAGCPSIRSRMGAHISRIAGWKYTVPRRGQNAHL